jgi:hypothetical protein
VSLVCERLGGHIIAALTERLPPQLEKHPQSPEKRPHRSARDGRRSEPRPVAEGTQEAPERRWWEFWRLVRPIVTPIVVRFSEPAPLRHTEISNLDTSLLLCRNAA